MVRSATKRKPETQSGEGISEFSLRVYPSIPSFIEPLSRDERSEVLALFRNEQFINWARSVFQKTFARAASAEGFAQLYGAWLDILARANQNLSNIGRAGEVGDERRHYSPVTRLFHHDAWQVNTFAWEVSRVPADFPGLYRLEVEKVLHAASTVIIRALGDRTFNPPLPYETVFDVLIEAVGRKKVEERYKFGRSGKKLTVLLRECSDDSEPSEVFLVGLDDITRAKLVKGVYDHQSVESIKEIDLISRNRVSSVIQGLAGSVARLVQEVGYRIISPDSHLHHVVKEHYTRLYYDDKQIDLTFEAQIDPKTIAHAKGGPAEQLRLLREYAREHPNEPIGSVLRQALDISDKQAGSEPAPANAMERVELQPAKLWVDRQKAKHGPNPIPFIREQYNAWLDGGFSITDLRKVDDTLATKLTRWLTHPDSKGLEGLKIDMTPAPKGRPALNADERARLFDPELRAQEPLMTAREVARRRRARERIAKREK